MTKIQKPVPPQEMIVVEGRDDTKRLIETFGTQVKTIETNGSAIDESILVQIERAQEEFGVIVLTDPDFQGKRIRNIITQHVPQAKHAYLTRAETTGRKKGQSLGVEHAKSSDIYRALDEVMTPKADQDYPEIPMSELIRLKLTAHPDAAMRRAYIADALRIGHVNGKQLQRKLALYQVSQRDLEKLLKEGEQNQFK